MSQKVTIEAQLIGQEQVNTGFRSMSQSSQDMSKSMRQAASDVAILGSGLMGFASLSKQFGIFNEEQARTLQILGSVLAVTGTLVQVTEVLTRANLAAAASFAAKSAATITDTAANWANVIAQNARAVATAIANAITNPLFLPVMLVAGATAAAGISALAPTRHTGGPILESGIYNLKAGEHVLTSNQYQNMGGVTVNVYGGTTEQVLSALRRSGYK